MSVSDDGTRDSRRQCRYIASTGSGFNRVDRE